MCIFRENTRKIHENLSARIDVYSMPLQSEYGGQLNTETLNNRQITQPSIGN